jgi:hypothetical protein
MKPTVSVSKTFWLFGRRYCHGHHPGAGQFVEQSRFSRIGITHQRDHRPVMAAPAFALDGAMLPHIRQVPLQPGDPLLDAPPVHLQLRLTRAPRADAAALAGKVRPHAGEAREKVLQLRQLDLETALARAGALCEDVQNQLGTVEHLARGQPLKVAPLRRGEFIVKDHGGHALPPALLRHVLGLPLADVIGRGGLIELLRNHANDFRAGGGGQFGEFIKGLLQGPFVHAFMLQPHQDRLLPPLLDFGIKHPQGV